VNLQVERQKPIDPFMAGLVYSSAYE
jgi:hypothetical protein